MYVIKETKTNYMSSSNHGSFHVGYYKPNGDFHIEESFDYVDSVNVNNKFEERERARKLCSRLNGGR